MAANDVVILSAARTPIGGLQGDLASRTAPQLGAAAISAAVTRARVEPEAVGEAIMGCVLPAGVGQAPARQAARLAGLPDRVSATTVNKVCGSGMKAIMIAADQLVLGRTEIAVAGGMESMSNAPYLLSKARGGYRLGHGEVKDHMFLDGLEDAYEHRLMGTYAEDAARHYQFTREQQDAYAAESLMRARRAQSGGLFNDEIVAVKVSIRGGEAEINLDEQPRKADPAKIPTLKPAFSKDGTVTAANSSSISDGAAALVLARTDIAEKLGLKPLARIVAQASFAHEPRWFTTAPVDAVKKVLKLAGWKAAEVDLFEINEAFANVAMIAMRDLALPHEKVNVNGGACALGHPIGASGARIMATLLPALKRRGLKRGVASLCIGGGEATALAVELL
ncbi:MAG: acetyl-CoA C-acyltransferase [Alphaproteobacteria bacterium]|nr:acetyl-CoA C-acyltransferase [Alphaproteobacteria bacterium]MDE2110766.1 acetyl-CoA C-acyltransferase [Alphaproteobacteria bacterium]MDE2494571.1 acetyl-CoA C-acyltransferase [Alphaproteobacteria bacterium]